MKRNEKTPIKRGLAAGCPGGRQDGIRWAALRLGIVFVAGRSAGRRRPFVISVMTAYLQDEGRARGVIAGSRGAACDYFRDPGALDRARREDG